MCATVLIKFIIRVQFWNFESSMKAVIDALKLCTLGWEVENKVVEFLSFEFVDRVLKIILVIVSEIFSSTMIIKLNSILGFFELKNRD